MSALPRGALLALAVALLPACGLSQPAQRGLAVARRSVAQLKADAERNLAHRLALARWIAEQEIGARAEAVGRQTGGVVSVGFARELIKRSLALERQLLATERVERANIDGNSAAAARLLGALEAEGQQPLPAVEALGDALGLALRELRNPPKEPQR